LIITTEQQQRSFAMTIKSIPSSKFLRGVLLADAATCIGTGLLAVMATNFLSQYLGLPADLLKYAGISLLPFAAFLIYLATLETISPSAVWLVIVLNALWTVDSILLLLAGWASPTLVGSGFVLFQAVGVAAFAALEYMGLRKSMAVAI
jgi:hypothetical protein